MFVFAGFLSFNVLDGFVAGFVVFYHPDGAMSYNSCFLKQLLFGKDALTKNMEHAKTQTIYLVWFFLFFQFRASGLS